MRKIIPSRAYLCLQLKKRFFNSMLKKKKLASWSIPAKLWKNCIDGEIMNFLTVFPIFNVPVAKIGVIKVNVK